ncbi:MAG: hypothetical protein LBN38_06950, partial [Verrucomicrobiota bacterium]|nr:hypothetical protein [Verrucomicrobiota bacterium]
LKQLASIRRERMKRLEAVESAIAEEDRGRMADEWKAEHEALVSAWPEIKRRLVETGDVACPEKEAFLSAWEAASEPDYVARLQALPAEAKAAGTAWLQEIVDAARMVQRPRRALVTAWLRKIVDAAR